MSKRFPGGGGLRVKGLGFLDRDSTWGSSKT